MYGTSTKLSMNSVYIILTGKSSLHIFQQLTTLPGRHLFHEAAYLSLSSKQLICTPPFFLPHKRPNSHLTGSLVLCPPISPPSCGLYLSPYTFLHHSIISSFYVLVSIVLYCPYTSCYSWTYDTYTLQNGEELCSGRERGYLVLYSTYVLVYGYTFLCLIISASTYSS